MKSGIYRHLRIESIRSDKIQTVYYMDNSLKQLLVLCSAICIVHACSKKNTLSSASSGTTTDAAKPTSIEIIYRFPTSPAPTNPSNFHTDPQKQQLYHKPPLPVAAQT